MLSGRSPPECRVSGKLTINGAEVHRSSEELKFCVGYVTQVCPQKEKMKKLTILHRAGKFGCLVSIVLSVMMWKAITYRSLTPGQLTAARNVCKHRVGVAAGHLRKLSPLLELSCTNTKVDQYGDDVHVWISERDHVPVIPDAGGGGRGGNFPGHLGANK